jgi:transcription termination factor Rho
MEMEVPTSKDISARVIDLVAPLSKNQRALIVAQPRPASGAAAEHRAFDHQQSSGDLIVLLIDERPEEITDMQRSVKGEVVSSTFDSRPYAQVADGHRRRAWSNMDATSSSCSFDHAARPHHIRCAVIRQGADGVDANALQRPKRFFGGPQHRKAVR